MKKEDGFYFIPKKWLGDADIIAMDWDCRGMHLHLMALAWQQKEKGCILDDEVLIRKVLGNPDINDWNNRIKEQIFSSWDKKNILTNGVERAYWYHPGLLKNLSGNDEKVVKKTRNKKPTLIVDNPDYDGFDLKSLLRANLTTTILHESASVEDKSTIWTLGLQLVKRQGDSEMKARGFLAKLIKDYGDKPVAEAIAQLSLKSIPPAEVNSYLIGMLKRQAEGEALKKKGTGRGSVSI